MLQSIAPIAALWLFIALLFKGFLDRSFVSCLVGSWCFLHLLWLVVRDPHH